MDYATSSSCSFHPKIRITGVCHLCLNERLLILAATTQSHHHLNYYRSHSLKQYRIKIPNKIFTFGNSIRKRFDSHCESEHLYSDGDDHNDSVSSGQDQDSFISIKFEDNGVASWDKGNSVSKVSLDHCNISWNNHKTTNLETATTNNREGKTVSMHLETPRGGPMRWRKRIGHVFQLIRWKRSSSKGNGGFHNNVRTSNGANIGWIRTLTKRRT